jgi:hypothetical protein
MKSMKTEKPTINCTWVLRGKVWSDLYHPEIYRPRDHGKHSKKQKR